MANRKTILIVCTGNVCRSPMAAGLLQHRLSVAGLADEYQVRSAGTWASTGARAAVQACQVMTKRGIDITNHRARDISSVDVTEAALILVMTRTHREAIVAEFPDVRTKTYLMSEMIGKSYDIADPYGSSLAHYAYCAEDLSIIIEAGFERILSLANENVP